MKHVLFFLLPCILTAFLIPIIYGYSPERDSATGIFDYTLSKPEKKFVLPSKLNEISGLTTISETEIACVQDEIGTIFIYDINKENITKEYPSGLTGDYEEIALVDNAMYLLRSDGVLIEYSNYKVSPIKIKEYNLYLPTVNNEGLCYDQKNNRLLIAAKTKAAKEIENKDIRLIYSFDLKSKTLSAAPVFKLSLDIIETKARANKIQIPLKTIKKTGAVVSNFNFRPSAIAVHPFSNLIYILSASDKLLLVIDSKGSIIHLLALDPALFNKPEGLTFLPDGDMLISNEAQKGKPTLLLFNYNKN